MPETSDWQLIGQVPIDTGRLALADPMNVDDVARHEEDPPGSMTYEVVTNNYGVGVAVLLGTGLGDGLYPVEARFEEADSLTRHHLQPTNRPGRRNRLHNIRQLARQAKTTFVRNSDGRRLSSRLNG
jgi:hypothetical protein